MYISVGSRKRNILRVYIPALFEVSRMFRLVWLDAANVMRRALHQRLDQLVRLCLQHLQMKTTIIFSKNAAVWAVWLSGNVVWRINEVILRRAGLVLRWVTAGISRYLTKPPRPTQPGHPFVGIRKMSTSDGYGY